MTSLRNLLGIVGAAVALAGLVAFFAPGVAASAVASDLHVTLVGAAALVQGLRVAREGWTTEVALADTGDPELVEDIPTPGDEFDENLTAARNPYVVGGRRATRDRLERLAVGVLRDRRGRSEEEAERMLEEGSWTDDPLAAEFFSRRARQRRTVRRWLRITLSDRSTYEWRAHRAVEEIERIWREER